GEFFNGLLALLWADLCAGGWGRSRPCNHPGTLAPHTPISINRTLCDAPVARTGAFTSMLWEVFWQVSSVRQRRTISHGPAPATPAVIWGLVSGELPPVPDGRSDAAQ